MAGLQSLASIVERPSAFDSWSNFAGQRPADDWDCLLTRTRDSDCLSRSNFESALTALGGESDDVVIHRYGHWACGWWEALAVRKDSPAHVIAEGIAEGLEDYPIVDEDHFSETEQTEANDTWRNCYSAADRIKYIREHRRQFEFHNFADMRGCVRGDYFAGHASELIG